MGAEGLSELSPLSGIYRGARTTHILDGTDDALISTLGRDLLEATQRSAGGHATRCGLRCLGALRAPARQGGAMNRHVPLAAMMVFYALGVLGPQLIADLGIDRQQLGWLTTSAFGLAALLSPWAGALVGSRNGLRALFVLVALSFSLVLVLPGFVGLVVALLFCGAAQALANPATNQAIAQTPDAPRASLVGIKLLAGIALPALSEALGWRLALACWAPLALLLALGVARQIAHRPRPRCACSGPTAGCCG